MTIILLIIVIALVVAWNFYPPFRAKMRGWSTIAEGFLGTILYYFGMFANALKEGQEAGYIPEDLVRFVPVIVFAWIVMKRFQTKTHVGAK